MKRYTAYFDIEGKEKKWHFWAFNNYLAEKKANEEADRKGGVLTYFISGYE